MLWEGLRWSSLKTRTTLFTLALFLATLWSLFFYSASVLREEMTRESVERQRSTSSVVATAIDLELQNGFRALHETAKIVSPLVKDRDALQASLNASSSLLHLFNGGIIVTGPDGTAIGDLPISTGRIGQFYGNDQWISAALREGKSSVSRPLMGKVLHVPVFALTVPVLDDRGTPFGSLSGVVTLDKSTFLDAIATNDYGQGGRFLLVDPRHRLIVTANDKRLVMQGIAAQGVNPALDRLLDGRGGTAMLVNRFGEEVLDVSNLIPAAGWYLVVSLPSREALAPLHTLQRRMMLATVLLTAVAGCLTWWMLRLQLAPLARAVGLLAKSARDDRPVRALPLERHDEVGELIGGFNRLLATLEKREEALRNSHETLHSILAATQDGYWRVDSGGHLRDVNATYSQQSGYTREELLGMRISDLDVSEADGDTVSHLRRVSASGGDQFESRHRRKDGSIWDVEVSVTYREVEGGQYFAFFRDLTERNRLAQALLTSQKLESLGTLAGGIAHDFNNILTPIVAHGELALMQLPAGDPVREDISELLAAAERAAALVKQILAISRKEDMAAPVPVNVGTLVKETVKFLRSSLPATIELRVNVDSACGPVRAVPSRLHQVILNLCTNASYAMADEGGVLTISLGCEATAEGGTRKVQLVVSDTGPGIPADILGRIFEPYFTTKPVGKGSGLGLAVVHGIVTGLGGEIRVQSKEGEGSTFEVLLPEMPRAEERPKAPRQDTPRGSGQHILVVDDEAQIRTVLQRLVSSLGYRVTVCGSGAEALDAFQKDPQAFDAVLTDYTMPRMTGLNLACEMLRLRSDLPIILGTGYAESVDEHVAAEHGLRGLVMKPYDRQKLGEALRVALGGSAQVAS